MSTSVARAVRVRGDRMSTVRNKDDGRSSARRSSGNGRRQRLWLPMNNIVVVNTIRVIFYATTTLKSKYYQLLRR